MQCANTKSRTVSAQEPDKCAYKIAMKSFYGCPTVRPFYHRSHLVTVTTVFVCVFEIRNALSRPMGCATHTASAASTPTSRSPTATGAILFQNYYWIGCTAETLRIANQSVVFLYIVMRDSMALHAIPRPPLHPPRRHMTGFQSRLDSSLRCS